jgi:hypothetical protein
VLMATAGVITATRDAAPDAWRRSCGTGRATPEKATWSWNSATRVSSSNLAYQSALLSMSRTLRATWWRNGAALSLASVLTQFTRA